VRTTTLEQNGEPVQVLAGNPSVLRRHASYVLDFETDTNTASRISFESTRSSTARAMINAPTQLA
jgi:hypothetical protein